MLSDICRIHFHIRSNAGIMAGNRDLVTNQKARIALSEVENLITFFILGTCSLKGLLAIIK